ncbi:polyketide beta-ketoacyl-synthase [Laccaria bicolor S238N-H82]|uniref:Polyketide beta-ketoacyl-synthase n=1 Tax=Laccaria bicolor (strain S238N-H82 / ATCC MYA-4686) TaxID=486041 RepID=B0CWL2_LACBS|nr:polyketide beta-ketoacyl-synthase [Laccaria bicolor S238N-H82]EDR13531.1 polyketide beta-ketoacyl-synthase [Laccaria bicolor S238N-H82]|eukprot:XP_001876029.1 polyketide beta-ketoacyl-synthase [Laccaria bicolor S238N-H82]
MVASRSSLDIPVFAGQGSTSSSFTQTRECNASSPIGDVFLSACHMAFYAELVSLSSSDFKSTGIDMSDFASKDSLLTAPEQPQYLHNPIISGSTIFLVQSLRYLAYMDPFDLPCASLRPFTDVWKCNADHGIGLLGFSSGIITACIASTSPTRISFLSQAVEAYRLVLWIGIRSQLYRQQALLRASLDANTDLPWSLVFFGIDMHGAQEALDTFNQDLGSDYLYITAVVEETCVTISGRPDRLAHFSTELLNNFGHGITMHPTTLNTLYHSPVHTDNLRVQVLSDVASRNISFPKLSDIIIPLRSTFTGELISEAASDRSLIELVLDMVIIQPVYWNILVQKISAIIPERASARLINMGPGNGLTRSLERAIVRNIPDLLDCTVVHVAAPESAGIKQEPIAIIGMAVNMPGASNTSQLWELLEKGLNTVSEIPEHRFKVSDYTNGYYPGRKMKAHTGNFLQGVDEFDHKFFKISPREARKMDPQQRVLLHVAYEALEDSGYVPYSSPCFDPRTFGCFVGSATHDYRHNLRDDIDVYYSTGTLNAFLSGRLSYAMQLSGPSVVVDTACSSSTVALYQAARALMNLDCRAAMVGGINVISAPDMFLGLDKGHFLSPAGQCRSFDASADGYARGEGCGVFVLKRLSDAVAENDKILGVIKGVEVNQSGLAQSITHPHAPTQSALLEQIISNSGIDGNRVNVIEAHGTGTRAGDAHELDSIQRVFSGHRSPSNPLYITSIKANIGHLEAASGCAGLTKLLLMFQHKIIPRQISLQNVNSQVAQLSADYALIPNTNIPWISTHENAPRVAILSNFGAAGSNVAVLVEEYVLPQKDLSTRRSSFVFGISAKSDIALQKMRVQLVSWLQLPGNRGTPLINFAYTSTARRQLYNHRLCASATDLEDLIQQLESVPIVRLPKKVTQVIFVFSGQGSQYPAMGSRLYETSPIFRQHIDQCHSILTESGFPGILPLIVGLNDVVSKPGEELVALQSFLFSLEFALSKLWLSWGIRPTAVVGHSLGEYVALVIAQVLSLKDAIFIVATRARLMGQKCSLNSTGMIAVSLGHEEVRKILESSPVVADLAIACYNSPTSCVVSGSLVQIKTFKCLLDAQCLAKNAILSVPFGYHSPAMVPLIDTLTKAVKSIKISPPTIPIISNVSGTVVQPGDKFTFNSAYFAQHCLQPVRFCEGIESFLRDPAHTALDLCWLEIGPHPVVLPMLKAQAKLPESAVLLESLRKREDAWTTLSKTLSRMYTSNLDVKWRSVFTEMGPASCVTLPSYPFSKEKFWVPFEEGHRIARESVNGRQIQHTFLHSWVQYPSVDNGWVAIFESPITCLEKYIRGHTVANAPLCPASVYFELLYAATSLAKTYLGFDSVDTHVVFREVQFSGPLVLDLCVTQTVQIILTLSDDNGHFSISSRTSSSPEAMTHASGEFRSQSSAHTLAKFARALPYIERRLNAIPQPQNGQAPKVFSARTAYEVIFPRVVNYSREYHTMQNVFVDVSGMEACATIKSPLIQNGENFVVHPIFLDTILHMAGFVANLQGDINDAYICKEVGSAKIIPSRIDPSTSYTIYCNTTMMPGQRDISAECFVLTTTSTREVIAHMKDIRFRKVRLDTLKARLCRMTQNGATPIEAPLIRHGDTSAASPELSSSFSNTEKRVAQIIGEACGVNVDNNSIGYLDVRAILSNVLGIAPENIDDTSTLDSLGLDSLASIEALHILNKVHGLQLPDNFFLEHPTLRSIQSYISAHDPRPRIRPQAPSLKVESSDNILVRIQASSPPRPPLFLIHDGSGLVNYCGRISPLGREVWGLKNPRFSSAQPWSSLVDMASAYAQSILKVSTGPLILGGVVAFEIAKQLAATHINVMGVILVDSPSPKNKVPLSAAMVDAIISPNTTGRVTEAFKLTKRQFLMNSQILAEYDLEAITSGSYPRLIFLRCIEGYNSVGVDVPLWFSDRKNVKGVTGNWEGIVGQPVQVLDIPGHHFEAFSSANVRYHFFPPFTL